MDGEKLAGYSEIFSISAAMFATSLTDQKETAETLYDYIINGEIGTTPVKGQETRSSSYFNDAIKMLSLISIAEGWWDPLN